MPSLACLALCFAAPFSNPRIVSAAVVSGPAVRMQTVELTVNLSAQFDNPFDSSQVSLDARIVGPSGKPVSIPGFYYRPYRRSMGKAELAVAYSSTEALARGETSKTRKFENAELLTPTAEPTWRVRFTPQEAGLHRISLSLRNQGRVASFSGPTVHVADTKSVAGFVRIDPGNPRAFRLSNGQSYFPVGANVGWAGERGTRDYEQWLPAYAKVGGNWGRVWMSPSWTTFGLDQPGEGQAGKGLGRIDLANAWRLDYVLDLARRHQIRLDLCIESYNVLRDGINWPEWERSVYNAANGGPVAKPSEFWTNPEARRAFRDKLRYIVARWGASPYVFAWEFWNEVDGVRDYGVEPIAEWHKEMAAYLRGIDPYRHLISTSFGGNGAGAGDQRLFSLRELDFSVAHLYEAADMPLAVASAQKRLASLGKPFFVAEAGADTTGPREKDDPDGLQLHDPLWASIASANSGGAMLWWWDSYIHPRNLYRHYAPVTRFLKGVDWGLEQMRPVEPKLAFLSPPSQPTRGDLRLEGGPIGWSPSPENRPQTIRISEEGAAGGSVGGVLHGTRNHANLHNPITFQTDLPRATRFVVEVSDVSGYGGAGLRILVDGQPALVKDFPDPDEDRRTETLKSFAGDYAVDLPAGRHTVKVENPGADWVKADFRFEGILTRTTPELIALASVGKGFAVAWLRQEDRSWRKVIEGKAPLREIAPSRLTLPGMRAGTWRAEIWDTWTGAIVRSTRLKVGKNGGGSVDLPPVRGDVAVRFVRQGA